MEYGCIAALRLSHAFERAPVQWKGAALVPLLVTFDSPMFASLLTEKRHFVCWLFRKTFWKEIAFPFFPFIPLFSPFLAICASLLPFLLSKSLALPYSLPASPSPAPSLVKLLLIYFISPRSLVYRGAFVLVGELSNLIKVRCNSRSCLPSMLALLSD